MFKNFKIIHFQDVLGKEIEDIKEATDFNSYLWIVYFLVKLCSVLEKTSQLGILIIDLLQTFSKSNNEEYFIFNEHSKLIIDICLKYSFLIENNEQNLNVILKESLLKIFK